MVDRQKVNAPHIKASRAKSAGTTAEFPDYKTGELVTCLSQGEKRFWHVLRWNDNVADIRSQYPLDGDLLDMIYRDRFGEDSVLPEYINSSNATLSTDFFVTMKDGTNCAYQVKPNAQVLSSQRDKLRIIIEKLYFDVQRIPWKIVFTDELDKDYADNIIDAVRYYEENSFHDKISEFQHLVATKKVEIDLQHGRVDWRQEAEKYFGEKK